MRGFVRTTDGSVQPGEIRVVTYNLLANPYAIAGHTYCPRQFLDWQYRMPLILTELLDYSADVVCLQEVETSFYNDILRPVMELQGYAGRHQSRIVPERRYFADEGIALFFKKDTFQELCHEGLVYRNHTYGTTSVQRELHMRDDGALMMLLRHKSSTQPILACCTHLFFNPNLPDIKALQAAILCQQISAFLRQQVQQGVLASADVPVIVGGDFNSLWRKYRSDPWDKIPSGMHLTTGVYKLLSTGHLPSSHPDHPYFRQAWRRAKLGTEELQRLQQLQLDSSGLQLQSMHMMAQGCEPPLTTKTANFAGCLDYIWVSPRHCKVTSTLAMPYPAGSREPHEVDFPAIPNEQWPSDHLAMGCDLVLLVPAAGAAAEQHEQHGSGVL